MINFDASLTRALARVGEEPPAAVPVIRTPLRLHHAPEELDFRYAGDLVRRQSDVTAFRLERARFMIGKRKPADLMNVLLCNLYDPLIERLGKRAHTFENGVDIGVYRRVDAPDIYLDMSALGLEIEAHMMAWNVTREHSQVVVTMPGATCACFGEPSVFGLHDAFLQGLIFELEQR